MSAYESKSVMLQQFWTTFTAKMALAQREGRAVVPIVMTPGCVWLRMDTLPNPWILVAYWDAGANMTMVMSPDSLSGDLITKSSSEWESTVGGHIIARYPGPNDPEPIADRSSPHGGFLLGD